MFHLINMLIQHLANQLVISPMYSVTFSQYRYIYEIHPSFSNVDVEQVFKFMNMIHTVIKCVDIVVKPLVLIVTRFTSQTTYYIYQMIPFQFFRARKWTSFIII